MGREVLLTALAEEEAVGFTFILTVLFAFAPFEAIPELLTSVLLLLPETVLKMLASEVTTVELGRDTGN